MRYWPGLVSEIPEGLPNLANILANWAHGRAVTVYVYGSRVRGDHRPDSDIDVYVELGRAHEDDDTILWWTHQQQTFFADLVPHLPCTLGKNGHETLDFTDKEMVRRVTSGRPVYSERNVVCIWVAPKPSDPRNALYSETR